MYPKSRFRVHVEAKIGALPFTFLENVVSMVVSLPY
jgi:hypothetical protein